MSPANAAFRLLPLLAALLCQVAAAQNSTAQTDAQRISQQLREAIDRANAQRPAPASVPRNRPAPPPAPTPSVSVHLGQGGAMSVAPTAPTAPAPTVPQPAAQAPTQPPAKSPARPAARAPAAATVADDEVAPPPRAAAAAPVPARAAPQRKRWSESEVQRQYERARAIAHGQAIPPQARLPRDEVTPVAARRSAKPQPLPSTWSYSGPGGPQAWAAIKPEYELCGSGQRQSPIHIETTATLQGPNEALGFDYRAGSGNVVHDGRTIRVDVQGEHLLTVRGSTWRLEQLLFRHPAEEKIDHQGFAMGVHLVHRNSEGQLAIVAVLLQPGEPSAFIDRVWTYLPLDVNDTVQMPAGWLEPATLLPEDRRYYQFFGSLTQPPCTEGVLWMVLKQPVTLSPAQLRLFAQMFPTNARPVQALNGRIVREAH